MEHETLSKIGLTVLLLPIIGAFVVPFALSLKEDLKTPPVKEPDKNINILVYALSAIYLTTIILVQNTETKHTINALILLPTMFYFMFRGTYLKGGVKEKGFTAQKFEYLSNIFFGAWYTGYHAALYLIIFIMSYDIYLQIFAL